MPKKHLSVGRTERTIRFGMNDRLLFVLDPERYDTVMRWLDDPPAPGPKLRSLLCPNAGMAEPEGNRALTEELLP